MNPANAVTRVVVQVFGRTVDLDDWTRATKETLLGSSVFEVAESVVFPFDAAMTIGIGGRLKDGRDLPLTYIQIPLRGARLEESPKELPDPPEDKP